MKSNFNTILVPIDFSEKSLTALEESFNLSKLTNLDITLLHVIRDSSSSIFSMFDEEKSRKLKKEYEDQYRNELVKIAREASKKSGVKVSAMISRGKEYDKILKASQLLESKFIVVGLNAEPFSNTKNAIGSVTSKLIRRAKCPVITVNNKHGFDGCRSILLPLDLSVETRQKVANAVELAKLFQSTIKIVSVIPSGAIPIDVEKLNIQMKTAENFIRTQKVEVKSAIIEKGKDAKSPAPLILKYAETQGDIDLIMIMTQQESGLFDLFVGSSAQYFIRNSKVPVMSIIPKQLGFVSIIP